MTLLRRAAALVLFAAVPLAAHAQPTVLDEVAATVGNRVVLRTEVEAVALQRTRGAAPSDDVWRASLRDLVDQAVLATVAERDTTIQITPEQVNLAVENRLNAIAQQVGGMEALERAYGRSVTRIREDLRTTFRDQMLAQEIRQRRMRGLRIPPSEVATWFRRIPTDSLPTIPALVRIAHVARFAEPPESVVNEARDIVAALRDSVNAGKGTFEEYATQYSEDRGSAEQGGRIAGVRLRDLVPEFAAVAARQTLGEISAPFRTVFGYHILRVNDRRGDVVDFSHILISIDNSRSDPAPAVAFLNTVRDSVVTMGLPFELMARRHSEDAASSALGGRIVDPQTRGRDLVAEDLREQFGALVDTLAVGTVSAPLEFASRDGRRGVHIVLVQSRTDAHTVTLEQDYARIEEIALQEKQEREMRTYLDQLRRQVFIEYRGKARELVATTP